MNNISHKGHACLGKEYLRINEKNRAISINIPEYRELMSLLQEFSEEMDPEEIEKYLKTLNQS